MNQEGNLELFQLELTKTELRTLSRLLPQGFSFEVVSDRKKTSGSRPTKKVFTNEKKPVPCKPENPTTTKPAIKSALRDSNNRKFLPPLQYKSPEYDSTGPSTPKSVNVNTPLGRKYYNILQKLKSHPSVGPFLYPVDVKGLGLVDYYSVIREPMDLSTVEKKLKEGRYAVASQFAEDVRRIWSNSMTYNMEQSSIYEMTLEMRAYFERLYRETDNSGSDDAVKNLERQVELLTKQITELHQTGLVVDVPTVNYSTAKIRHTSNSKPSARSIRNAKLMEKPLSAQEKTTLGQNIRKLSPEYLRGVWKLISEKLAPEIGNKEEIQFDIESLPVSVARELDKFVKNKLSVMNRNQKRAKAKEEKKSGEVKVALPNYKQQEGYLEVSKGEDDITTQHHSVMGSDGGNDGRGVGTGNEDDLLSKSSDSSFISDSESEGDEREMNRKSKQMQQEQGRFLAVSGDFMLNSLIGN